VKRRGKPDLGSVLFRLPLDMGERYRSDSDVDRVRKQLSSLLQMANEGENRPTAFISYAQSSSAWQETVLSFTAGLRVHGGVDAELDLFHGADHQRWATFGPNLIQECDFTLIAPDPAYKRRWLGQEKKGVGAGAAREAAAIRAIYEKDQEEFLRRVKVVLLPGAGLSDIPEDLLGDCERFPIDSFDEAGLERLLRSIWGKPKILKPPLGDIPALPPQAVSNFESEVGRRSRALAALPGGNRKKPAATADARDQAALSERLKRVKDDIAESRSAERKELLRRQATLEALLRALSRLRRGGGKARPVRGLREAATGLIAIALLGVSFGLTSSDSASPDPARKTAAASLELQVPSGWRRVADAPPLGNLGIAHPINLAGSRGVAAVAGISDATGATLLPTGYASRAKEAQAQAVSLGPLQAYRYGDLRGPGSRSVTIFTAPTTLGVATLVCVEGSRGDLGSRDGTCDGIAATMRLRRGKPYELGPAQGLAKALRKRLTELGRRRAKLRRKLAETDDAADQADLAAKLGSAFHVAAKGLGSGSLSPEVAPAVDALARVLHDTERAYERLSAAARREDRLAYRQEKRAVRKGEAEVNGRLKTLRGLGYRVGGKKN
jgi:hypothetical protein